MGRAPAKIDADDVLYSIRKVSGYPKKSRGSIPDGSSTIAPSRTMRVVIVLSAWVRGVEVDPAVWTTGAGI
jgi:hypothetical protein